MGALKSKSNCGRSDDDLIQDTFHTTNTPQGSDYSSSSRQTRTPSTAFRTTHTPERPPPSVFRKHPTVLITGFLRSLFSISFSNHIPKFIQELCFLYYTERPQSLVLDSNRSSDELFYITNIDDNLYESIHLKANTKILGISPILKLSSLSNVEIDWHSLIQIDDHCSIKNGTIVLTVFGDINMGKNTQLTVPGDDGGRIYIQCNNLIMRSGSLISTTSNSDETTSCGVCVGVVGAQRTDSRKHGNVYFEIRQSLIMDKHAMIRSGNVTMICSNIKLGRKSKIKALRKNIEIYCKNGILSDHSDGEWRQHHMSAVQRVNVLNGSELQDDPNKLKETMRNNVSYKLTMFEGDDDTPFECCVCWDKEPDVILDPCNHAVFCSSCIEELNPTECPVCRVQIVKTTRF